MFYWSGGLSLFQHHVVLITTSLQCSLKWGRRWVPSFPPKDCFVYVCVGHCCIWISGVLVLFLFKASWASLLGLHGISIMIWGNCLFDNVNPYNFWAGAVFPFTSVLFCYLKKCFLVFQCKCLSPYLGWFWGTWSSESQLSAGLYFKYLSSLSLFVYTNAMVFRILTL